jgi:4'-phosphopantetheinyl transferase
VADAAVRGHLEDDARLGGDDVHVWLADLSVPEDDYRRLSGTLSDEEVARSRRLRFEALRRRFVVGRGTLRLLLGRYLDLCPAQVRLTCAPMGKPLLDGSHGSDLAFSVSHSKLLAVYAFARSAAVGVDVEHGEAGDCDAIVRQFFSAREWREYSALPACEKRGAFLRSWTRKEACLKATGAGMSRSLSDVEVPIMADGPATLSSAGDVTEWWLEDVPAPAGFIGAVAVRGGPRRLTIKRLEREAVQ